MFVYTREAHPAERLRHHRSMDEKRANALAFKNECNVRRRILVDDLAGTVHHRFGLLPNMTWILGRGLILYKASWTVADDVEAALEQSLAFIDKRRELRGDVVPVYSERAAFRVRDEASFRAGLERAGPQAVRDFFGRE